MSKTSSPGSEIGGGETPSTGGDESRVKRKRKGADRDRKPKKSRPLDQTMLRDLALSYAARFATTGAKLEQYLARKIQTRGVAEDADGRTRDLDVTDLVTQMIELGYVNDDAYARSRSRDLTARGYGARRVEQALWAAGVDEEVRENNAPGEAESKRAAVLLAKKRRFGPFARPDAVEHIDEDENGDPLARRKQREKQVAAMLRAGHQYDHVRFIIDAATMEEVDEWLAEAEDAEEPRESGSW
ncbi:regulatory protein RecX [Erythrobacter sp. Alg231-14]|uniref:regulatory protein RecX n=1 Tax=Erythrobacter sp. Alg231-14 TaxID=1922225 RepID=UPI00307C72AC